MKKNITTLINAHNIRQGGGVSVLYNFLEYLHSKELDSFFFILLPNTKLHKEHTYKYFNDNRFKFCFIPVGLIGLGYRLFFLRHRIKRIINKKEVEKIFSLGNLAIRSNKKQVLLIQNAFPFINDRRIFAKLPIGFSVYIRLMAFLIKRNIKYADKIFVQTNCIKDDLITQLNISPDIISIFPNLKNIQYDEVFYSSNYNQNSHFKLLFLSNYYPHKNFEILSELVKHIDSSKIPIQISLTLTPKELKKSGLSYLLIEYSHIVKNIGRIDSTQISEAYKLHDAMFLPSLVESFSTNYLEALIYKRTIITSNLRFATEICGEIAFYFDPFDALDAFNSIKSCFMNYKLREYKLSLYDEKMKAFHLYNQDYIYKQFFNA